MVPSLLQDLAVARYKLSMALQRNAAAKEEVDALLAKAEADATEALRADPASASLWRMLGMVARRPALRQHAFLAAIEANDVSGGAWADLGHFYLMQGADDLASRAYAEAQLLEPHAPAGWLGQALVEELIANRRLSTSSTDFSPPYCYFLPFYDLPDVETLPHDDTSCCASKRRQILRWS